MPDLIDLLAEQALAGELTWQEAGAALGALEKVDFSHVQSIYERLGGRGEPDWTLVAARMALQVAQPFTPAKEFTATLQPAPEWWGGATADEIRAFDLYPGGPTGADLPSVSNGELHRRLGIGIGLLRAGPASRWLMDYVQRLVDEQTGRDEQQYTERVPAHEGRKTE